MHAQHNTHLEPGEDLKVLLHVCAKDLLHNQGSHGTAPLLLFLAVKLHRVDAVKMLSQGQNVGFLICTEINLNVT